MCVLFIAWQVHGRYRLVVAANRDERRARATAALGRWADRSDVIGGRDLEAGGTWMAVSTGGRFAAVTNFREVPLVSGPRSRGVLVSDFVCGEETLERYARGLSQHESEYAGANLFTADADSLWHWTNRGEASGAMTPGLYGVSNGRLSDDWPKMRRGRETLARIVSASATDLDEDALFTLLADRTHGAEHELPDTGVGRDLERTLSPIFIAGDDYGTRSSTVLLVGHDGRMRIKEKRWGKLGVFEGQSEVEL